jgi:glycopeptide antibiotics resistance protein
MFLKHTKWALLWALLILILCGIPGRDIPHISFLELLSFDKFVHAGIFCVLVLLMIRGFLVQTRYVSISHYAKKIAFLISVVYGGLLEIMQGTLFEERSADVYDFIANSVGCLLAIAIYSWTEKMFLSKFIK